MTDHRARRERRGESGAAHRCPPPSGGCRPCRPTTSWAEARTDTPGPLLRPGFAATAVGKQSPGAIRPSDREPEPTHRAQSLHEQSPRTIQTHRPAPGTPQPGSEPARTVPTDHPHPPTRPKACTHSPHGPSRPTNRRPEATRRAQSTSVDGLATGGVTTDGTTSEADGTTGGTTGGTSSNPTGSSCCLSATRSPSTTSCCSPAASTWPPCPCPDSGRSTIDSLTVASR